MNAVALLSQPTMTSREIAELCDKRHDNVMADCRKLIEFYGQTYSPEKSGELVSLSTYVDGSNRSVACFALTREASLDLVTGYSLPHRHAVNKRWQQLETQVAKPQLPDFSDPAAAARAWADEVEAKQQARALLAAQKPAVEFVERYVDATGSKGFREVCKLLGVKENEFRAFLQDTNIVYKLAGRLVPYQQHIDAGRFEIKAGVTNDENAYAFNQTRFTPKGIEWIAGKWMAHKLDGKAA
jgi:phage antirepressor YoqD-like protein